MKDGDDALQELLGNFVEARNNSVLVINMPEVAAHILMPLREELADKEFEKLDVILQTPGGDVGVAYQITKMLFRRAKLLNIFVPLYAKSAGTLICLAADQIILTELGELGPLDTQI